MIKPAIVFCSFLLAGQAWAINKCTGADGKVGYQEAPCAAAQTSESVRVAPTLSGVKDERWDFDRDTDSMTGEVTCSAVSPPFFKMRGPYAYNYLQVKLHFLARGRILASANLVRDSKDIFHNTVTGMGIKPQPGTFAPLDVKLGQKAVASTQSAQLVDQMLSAQSFKLRVRFWPYDELTDTAEITTLGLRQAVVLAGQCAKTLT